LEAAVSGKIGLSSKVVKGDSKKKIIEILVSLGITIGLGLYFKILQGAYYSRTKFTSFSTV